MVIMPAVAYYIKRQHMLNNTLYYVTEILVDRMSSYSKNWGWFNHRCDDILHGHCRSWSSAEEVMWLYGSQLRKSGDFMKVIWGHQLPRFKMNWSVICYIPTLRENMIRHYTLNHIISHPPCTLHGPIMNGDLDWTPIFGDKCHTYSCKNCSTIEHTACAV